MQRLIYASVFLLMPGAAAAQPQEVSVCVRFGVIMDFRTLKLGESTASQIFEPTGVRLRWNCAAPAETQVIVQIKNDTPDTFHRGALAYALPFARDGVRVVVNYSGRTRSSSPVAVRRGHLGCRSRPRNRTCPAIGGSPLRQGRDARPLDGRGLCVHGNAFLRIHPRRRGQDSRPGEAVTRHGVRVHAKRERCIPVKAGIVGL